MRGRVGRREEDDREHVSIESGPYHHYQRVVTLLDAETHLPMRVDFYDATGARFRELRFEDSKLCAS